MEHIVRILRFVHQRVRCEAKTQSDAMADGDVSGFESEPDNDNESNASSSDLVSAFFADPT